ncbi:MAG TPA: redoxin domain-containing protein [Abditibacteriaceae bacterium]|jgi:peroxiredoxin
MKKYFPFLFVAAVPIAAALFLAADRAQQKALPASDLISISQEHGFSEMAGEAPHKASKHKMPAAKGKLRIGDAAPALQFTTLKGEQQTLAPQGQLSLVMLADTTCPCVKAYDTRMKALVEKFPALRVTYVFPSPLESKAQVQKFVAARGYNWPIVYDQKQTVFKALGGKCTTESFLFDTSGTLRYHGRIDDNIYDAPNVKVRDLENAINAVVAQKTFVKTEVPAYGCVIPRSTAPSGTTSVKKEKSA